MLGIFGKKGNKDKDTKDITSEVIEPVKEPEKKQSWFNRLRTGLSRTRGNLGSGLATVFLGRKTIDDELFEEIETLLLTADVGVEATTEIIKELTQQVSRKQLHDPTALFESLKQLLCDMLKPCEQTFTIDTEHKPYVILMVGVNGSGKTTSIGKLTNYYKQQNYSLMLAAGDTFRAAAIEQLQVWGERNHIPVVSQHTGADSASVIFDAMQSASAKNCDLLIADTAGRLHTQSHLMAELEKVTRVLKKLDATAPHQVVLVLDAGIGQNALQQAKQFQQAVNVNSIILTKLDGTAKGGIIFSIAKQLAIPISFIGVGEGIDDLRPFKAEEFVEALFATQESSTAMED